MSMTYHAEHVRDRAKAMIRDRMVCLWEHRDYFDSEEARARLKRGEGITRSYYRLDDIRDAAKQKLSGQIFNVRGKSQIKFSTAFAGNTQASKYFEFIRGYITTRGQIIATTRKRSRHIITRRLDYTLRKQCRTDADVRSLCADIFKAHDEYVDIDAWRISVYMEIKPYLDSSTGPSNWHDLAGELLACGLWPADQPVSSGIDFWSESTLEICLKYVHQKMSKDVNYWLDKAYDLKGDIIERGAGGAK